MSRAVAESGGVSIVRGARRLIAVKAIGKYRPLVRSQINPAPEGQDMGIQIVTVKCAPGAEPDH
jgi:hypothetical protein